MTIASTEAAAPQRERPPLIGLASLMRKAFSGVDLKPLGAQLVERSTRDPGDANALMDLATVLILTGNRELAMAAQAQALQLQQLYHLPAAGEARVRVLALMAPGDLMANTPLEFLVENSDVALDLLYLGPGLNTLPQLPEHDVLFVAVGESDENRSLLTQLDAIVRDWPRPVLNLPANIVRLARDSACHLMRPVPGVLMPATARVGRVPLERLAHGEVPLSDVLEDGAFPLIARPVGSHAGTGLERIDGAAALGAYLRAMPQQEFYVSRFIDYRNPDGQFRKYRIMLIDGQPFVAHMAISSHWMIHYLNAGMTESAEKRAEEARVMAEFDQGFARRHAEALRRIHDTIGLDYVGLDCGESADGKLLIFEIDSDMIVHALDPVDLFPYKRPQMQKLFAAFRRMLLDAADRRN